MGRLRAFGIVGAIAMAMSLLAGCAWAPQPAPGRSTHPAVTVTPADPAGLVVPPESRDELGRATTTVSPAESLESTLTLPPSVQDVAVDFSCAGPESLGWAITDSEDRPVASVSEMTCDGTPEHDVVGDLRGMSDGTLQIKITGSLGATAAYAIVTPDGSRP